MSQVTCLLLAWGPGWHWDKGCALSGVTWRPSGGGGAQGRFSRGQKAKRAKRSQSWEACYSREHPDRQVTREEEEQPGVQVASRVPAQLPRPSTPGIPGGKGRGRLGEAVPGKPGRRVRTARGL